MSEKPAVLQPVHHYRTGTQCALWQRVHEQYSPLSQPGYRETYRDFFIESCAHLSPICPGLVLLGAGGGWKEALLAGAVGLENLQCIRAIDADPSLLRQTGEVLRSSGFSGEFDPLVGDFLEVDFSVGSRFGLAALGILPNVEPEIFLQSLGSKLPDGTPVWMSANLTSSDNGAILAQYRNVETERWLEQFFIDQGVSRDQFRWDWLCQPQPFGSRVEGMIEFNNDVELEIDGQNWHYYAGERLLAFYSNRMDPQRWEIILNQSGFRVILVEQACGDGLWFLTYRV